MREMNQTIAVAAVLVVFGLAASGVAGCAGGPRSKPIPTTEIDKGTGTLQGARKFLEGRWALTSFEVFPPNAEKIAVPGSGVMTYDDFGNLRMEIRTDEQTAVRLEGVGIFMERGVISSDGRTTIDIVNKTLTYVLEGQPPAGAPVGPLATSRPRYWDVTTDTLTLSTKDDSGRTLSIAKWKRST
jgi:hypothetical protein